MTRQKWMCEACGKSGTVRLKQGEDAWAVVLKIKDDHEVTSPECEQPIALIRVEVLLN